MMYAIFFFNDTAPTEIDTDRHTRTLRDALPIYIPQVDIDGNVIGHDTSPYVGVSNLSYNVTLAYDRKPVGVRLSYVWRKNFLSNNEARLFANPIGVWRVPEKSLDLQVTLDVTKRQTGRASCRERV